MYEAITAVDVVKERPMASKELFEEFDNTNIDDDLYQNEKMPLVRTVLPVSQNLKPRVSRQCL